MVKKKRRKRKSKYTPLPSKSKLAPVETGAQLRAKFPKKLVAAYLKVVKAGFEDEKLYEIFVKLRREYLGDKADDVIECGRVVVQLSTATANLKRKTKK